MSDIFPKKLKLYVNERRHGEDGRKLTLAFYRGLAILNCSLEYDYRDDKLRR
jgi:hypothetical protein